MTPKEREDAAKLLELIGSSCPKTARDHDHAWRDCPRCAMVEELEQRGSLARRLLLSAAAALRETRETPAPDGSVMVRVDAAYVEQMRGQGLAGPFSRVQLDERDGVPTLLLTVEPTPTPDTVEWWRAVAQGLGAEIAKLKALAVDPSAIPADLVRISRPSPVGQSPAALTAPATGETLKGSDQ